MAFMCLECHEKHFPTSLFEHLDQHFLFSLLFFLEFILPQITLSGFFCNCRIYFTMLRTQPTESVAGFVLPGADVESCEEDGVVVVSALSASQSGLPVAEAVQCVVCMVVDHQAIL